MRRGEEDGDEEEKCCKESSEDLGQEDPKGCRCDVGQEGGEERRAA
jgi:hypothetical protein